MAMTKTYAACTPDTLVNIARRDIAHAAWMLGLAGLPYEVEHQLRRKMTALLDGVWDTYSPDALAALGVKPPEEKHTNTTQNLPYIESDEKVSPPC